MRQFCIWPLLSSLSMAKLFTVINQPNLHSTDVSQTRSAFDTRSGKCDADWLKKGQENPRSLNPKKKIKENIYLSCREQELWPVKTLEILLFNYYVNFKLNSGQLQFYWMYWKASTHDGNNLLFCQVLCLYHMPTYTIKICRMNRKEDKTKGFTLGWTIEQRTVAGKSRLIHINQS